MSDFASIWSAIFNSQSSTSIAAVPTTLPSIPASAPIPPFAAFNATRWISPTVVSGILPVLSGIAVSGTVHISIPLDIPSTLITRTSSSSDSSSSSSSSSSTSSSSSSTSSSSSSTSAPSSTTTQPPSPPPTLSPPNCKGINNGNWIPHDKMATGITDFCTVAAIKNKRDDNSGSLALTYWNATADRTDFWVDWPGDPSIQKDECITSMTSIMDNCDGVPANPKNNKHGGSITYGVFTYHIQPTLTRTYVEGRCSLQATAEDNGNGWTVTEVGVWDQDKKVIVDKTDKVTFTVTPGNPDPHVKLMNLDFGDLYMTTTGSGKPLLFKTDWAQQTFSKDDKNCYSLGTDGNKYIFHCDFDC